MTAPLLVPVTDLADGTYLICAACGGLVCYRPAAARHEDGCSTPQFYADLAGYPSSAGVALYCRRHAEAMQKAVRA